MVYLFDHIDAYPLEEYMQFLPYLPTEQRKKIMQHTDSHHAQLSLISLILLLYGLHKEHHLTKIPTIAYMPYGKPYFPEYPSIHFNISHCPCAVACAISSTPIGVDIQDIARTNRPHIWSRVCSDSELIALQQSDHPNKLFARFWSLKESYVKYTGQGIRGLKELQNLSFAEYTDPNFIYQQVVFSTIEYPLFAAATCSQYDKSNDSLLTLEDIHTIFKL